MRLTFSPGEAAQVDFGAGPQMVDPATGEIRRTWAFVMTLCFSRHQYVEFVWDQSVRTWLGCHRRAFEWFGAVPARLIIDNAKCAITRACMHDPQVQRAYAECAEGPNGRFSLLPSSRADPWCLRGHDSQLTFGTICNGGTRVSIISNRLAKADTGDYSEAHHLCRRGFSDQPVVH